MDKILYIDRFGNVCLRPWLGVVFVLALLTLGAMVDGAAMNDCRAATVGYETCLAAHGIH